VTGLAGGVFAALKEVVEIACCWRLATPSTGAWCSAGAARTQSRRPAGALADHDHHDYRPRLRRLPLALFSATDPGIAHEASLRRGRQLAGVLLPRGPHPRSDRLRRDVLGQMFTVFSFLVLLRPASTSTSSLHCRRSTSAVDARQRRSGVDLAKLMDDSADAAEMKVGVRSASDLVWKDALDAFTCTECGRCKTPARRS